MKMQEIRALSDADLLEKIKEMKTDYAKLKILHKVSPLENPLELRHMRKTIARLLTEKKARGLK
ncbi:MAG: 50S ribosomal protein L29 [Chlorobi bacterium]|nr:50S ribosomal protein L29 [Chlorobiota bacterium]